MQDKKEQETKEEVSAYITIACRLWGKCSQKMLWLYGFYLCLSLQLRYVTVDISNAPPAESRKPKKAEAVEYTGVKYAQPWGHKMSLQGTRTYILNEALLMAYLAKVHIDIILYINIYT